MLRERKTERERGAYLNENSARTVQHLLHQKKNPRAYCTKIMEQNCTSGPWVRSFYRVAILDLENKIFCFLS